jgi:hypothetical protein
VTSVLDAGIDPPVARDIQTWLAAGHPGPRFLTTGPYVRPAGGYGWPGFGAETTPAEVEAKLDLISALGGRRHQAGHRGRNEPAGDPRRLLA